MTLQVVGDGMVIWGKVGHGMVLVFVIYIFTVVG